jgi:3-methyladenine DNA glycosylase AlkD
VTATITEGERYLALVPRRRVTGPSTRKPRVAICATTADTINALGPPPPRPRSSETPWCAAVPFLPSLWLAWPDWLPTRLLEIARGRGPRAGRCGNAGPAGRFGGYRRSVAAEEILSELRQLGEPQRVAALRRSGVTSPAFGVGLPALRSLAKRIGRDRELALALWETGVREARILASLIDERDRVTRSQMDRWAETFDSWEICDQCCQNLFAHTAFALDKAVEWTQRPEELVKRAGFVLVAVSAVHDKTTDDQRFHELLPTLLSAADDERLYVRKGASWALRQIGKRSDRLRERVLAVVGPYVDDDSGGIRWVAREAARELRSWPRAGKVRGKPGATSRRA